MNIVFRFISAALLLMPLISNASSWTGKTTTIRYGVSPARVSIQVGAHHGSPCSTYLAWFAFEGSSASEVSIWASAFLEAQNAGRTVTIVGTGLCDSFGVEGVAYFDVK